MTAEQTRIKLTHALTNLDSLPAMPAIAQKLLVLNLDTDEGEAQLLFLIEQDPQISAKLISLANSPVMGVTRKVYSVADAAMLLGLTRVKAVALGIAAMSNFARLPRSAYFTPQALWLHSLAIAIAMHTISQTMPTHLRPLQDHIYLTGLLHDIGFMAIHHLDSVASNELHHRFHLQQAKRPVMEIELATIGISHCQIGAQLARQWHLPDTIISVLSGHHTTCLDDVSTSHSLTRLLMLTEKLLPDFGISECTRTAISLQEWQELGIDPAREEELRDSVNELAIQAAQIADIF